MTVLSRIFRRSDPRDPWRALWHDVVRVSREPDWYAQCGVADSVEGRFDMISLVLTLVLLRMEKSAALAPATALVTEWFVADMDRQLRDTGVGDLMVGKNMGKLMSALGGRLSALRDAMPESDANLASVLARNVNLVPDAPGFALAVRVRALYDELGAQSDAALRSGQVRRGDDAI